MKDRVKELCKKKGVSMNTAEKEIGLAKGYISKLDKSVPNMNTMQKIADYFNVTSDFLMNGDLSVSGKEFTLTNKGERDIEKIINSARDQLTNQEGLMFDGKPASQEAIDSILSGMRVGMEIAKEKNKKLYTPKNTKRNDILWKSKKSGSTCEKIQDTKSIRDYTQIKCDSGFCSAD